MMVLNFQLVLVVVLAIAVVFAIIMTIRKKISESKEDTYERSYTAAPVPHNPPVVAADPYISDTGRLHDSSQYATFLEIINAYENAGYIVDIHSSSMFRTGEESECAHVLKDNQVLAEMYVTNSSNPAAAREFAAGMIDDIAADMGYELLDLITELKTIHSSNGDLLAVWTYLPDHMNHEEFTVFIRQGFSNPFFADANTALDIAQIVMNGRKDYQIASAPAAPNDWRPDGASKRKRGSGGFVFGFFATILVGFIITISDELPVDLDFSAIFDQPQLAVLDSEEHVFATRDYSITFIDAFAAIGIRANCSQGSYNDLL